MSLPYVHSVGIQHKTSCCGMHFESITLHMLPELHNAENQHRGNYWLAPLPLYLGQLSQHVQRREDTDSNGGVMCSVLCLRHIIYPCQHCMGQHWRFRWPHMRQLLPSFHCILGTVMAILLLLQQPSECEWSYTGSVWVRLVYKLILDHPSPFVAVPFDHYYCIFTIQLLKLCKKFMQNQIYTDSNNMYNIACSSPSCVIMHRSSSTTELLSGSFVMKWLKTMPAYLYLDTCT